jgi:hypothetical protein
VKGKKLGRNRTSRLSPLHRADLDRARLRPEQKAAVQIKCVLHIPRRVRRGHVEQVKVILLGLNLGPLRELEPQAPEQVHEVVEDRLNRVGCPARDDAPRQRGVDSPSAQHSFEGRGVESCLSAVEERLDLRLERVNLRPGERLGVGRQSPEPLHQRCDGAFATEEPRPRRGQISQAGDALRSSVSVCLNGSDFNFETGERLGHGVALLVERAAPCSDEVRGGAKPRQRAC